MIRTRVVTKANAPVNKLNKKASELAKASAQSAMAEALQDSFTQEELAVYRRGRNAHSYTKAKNATTGDYRRATGFEAVFGYLYLKGELQRVEELFGLAMASREQEG
jgi:ribonuclease-3 family protein